MSSNLIEDFSHFEPNSADYKKILDHMADGVYFTDTRRVIGYWNRGAERISGYSAEEVIGKACFDNLLQHVDDSGRQLCFGACPLAKTLEDGEMRQTRVYLHHADGHRVPVMVRTGPIRDSEGNIVGAVEVFSDNTKLVQAINEAKEYRREATMDAVTGISNRSFGDLKLDTAIHACHSHNLQAGVLFVDIDDFKSLNDKHGHTAGDKYLRMIARTLEENIRDSDVVSRWGGDEFLLILEDVRAKDIEMIAGKLVGLIDQSSTTHQGQELHRTVSIGATQIRTDDTNELLLERADDLMYQAKKEGGNRFSYS